MMENCGIENPWWNDESPNFSNFTTKKLTWDELGFKIQDSDDRFKIIQGGV